MINVRPAVLEDQTLIATFQQQMANEAEGVSLAADVLEQGVRAALIDPLKGEYLIAELDEEPVGCLLTVREWSDWRNGEVIWIHSLYVTQDARRKGVFKQLYVYLRQMVETDSNLKGLRLYVHRDNTLAQNAYKALGMDGDHYQLFEWMPEG
ncbi:MAG: GNAT family N-acetyltransferase [Dehalococcoidia bacterium]|nr:GNAT family N-acetyltransferase [Dehalococcoidia bacterium]